MSIDKAILSVKHSYMSDDDKETADFIINTMHKYKQIEQIIDDWNNGKFSDAVGCLRVKAVVEDGKTD